MLKITPMTRADIPVALRLTQIENWGYLSEDIARLIEFEPQGCFVARLDGRRVGIISTTSFKNYAFVGTLIVRKAVRGRGIGRALMETAISYLHKIGIGVIELDADYAGVNLYRKLGFEDKYLSHRLYHPKAAGAAHTLLPANQVPEKIFAFDKKQTGLDRERVLSRFIDEYSDAYCILRNRRVAAYAIVRPRGGGQISFGPYVAANPQAADTLLQALLKKCAGRRISMAVPEVNQEAVQLLVKRGFQYQIPCVRMYLGRRRTCENGVYGLLSPEKG